MGYQLGSNSEESEEQNMYKVKINNLIINQGVDGTAFEYSIPTDVQAVDITEEIKSRF